MFKISPKFICVTLFCIGLCAGVAGIVYNLHGHIVPGKCVATNPLQCTAGLIVSNHGMLSSGPDSYYLWFKGTTLLTKEPCESRRRVTATFYSQMME